jgi:hypothetical protein
VTGPFFFRENTVNNTNYLNVLELSAVLYMVCIQPNVLFQQDDAPPHFSLAVSLWIKLIQTDGLGGTDQTLGSLAPPI